MKRKRHSPEQIVARLREAEAVWVRMKTSLGLQVVEDQRSDVHPLGDELLKREVSTSLPEAKVLERGIGRITMSSGRPVFSKAGPLGYWTPAAYAAACSAARSARSRAERIQRQRLS